MLKEDANVERDSFRPSILLSPGFAGGLGLLLLNDFLLKTAFPNWLTGKLSDIAGLFIFPLFLVALRPRFKLPIYLVSAGLFLLWKSPIARPWIILWNDYTGLTLGRVEDLTDLLALLALPISYIYESSLPKVNVRRSAILVVCSLSIFAFTATSFVRHEQNYHDEYLFPFEQGELVRRMEMFSEISLPWHEKMTAAEAERIKMLRLEVPFTCNILFRHESDAPTNAVVIVSGSREQAKITLMKLTSHGGPGTFNPGPSRKYFEREFIEPLRQGTAAGSRRIMSIHQL